MTTKQIHIIRSSWRQAGEEPLTVGILFYDRLFTLVPEVRYVFKSPVSIQTIGLMKTVGYIINKLDEFDEIIYDITATAQEYAVYGLKALHYQAVGHSLLWALEKRLEQAWNDELMAAWISFYEVLSERICRMAMAA